MIDSMLLISHILIALASVICTTYLLFRPSGAALRISQILLAGTLTSGTFLVVSNPMHILQACIMGVVYGVGTITAIIFSNGQLKVKE